MTSTFVHAAEYASRDVEIVTWSEPPVMDVGAPVPVGESSGDSLFVAYVCDNPEFPGWSSGAPIEHPGFDFYSAVLRFDGAKEHYLGPPGDEALHLHPLFPMGLTAYGFHEVSRSPMAVNGLGHWIITFHDETLEAAAVTAQVYRERVDGTDTSQIVKSCAHEDRLM